MQHEEALKMVQSVITSHEDKSPDEYNLETTWKELGADSLDVVEMCILLENDLTSEFSNVHIDTLKTVGDLVKLVEGKDRQQSEGISV